MDRHVDLVVDRLRLAAANQDTDRLTAQERTQVRAAERGLQPVQTLRVHRLDRFGVERRIVRFGVVRTGRALRRLPAVDRLRQTEEGGIVLFQVVPGAEPGLVFLGVRMDQRIVAEQVAQPQHHVVDLGDGGVGDDHHDIAVRQAEGLAVAALDQGIEAVGGDAQMVLAAVMGLQGREVQVNGAAAVGAPAQTLDHVQQQDMLVRALFRPG